MSEMRKLLESISNFSVADPKAPEVKEEDDKLDADEAAIAEEIMQEYKYFVSEADPPPAGQPQSPVANINPPGSGNPATPGAPAANTAPSQTGAAPQPGTAAAGSQAQAAKPGAPAPTGGQPAAGAPQTPPAAGSAQTPPANKPAGATQPPAGATAQPPGSPAQAAAAKPGGTGAPGAGSATPPNPADVKKSTDAVTKILNNPSDPMNAELQALLKKSGQIPH